MTRPINVTLPALVTRDTRARVSAYWIATTLIAFAIVSGGLAQACGVPETVQGVVSLGYPAYFVTILGAWKLLGGLAILAPRTPRLKEWAYAGIVFDLSGAALSYVAVGRPTEITAPVVLLAIALVSWTLRPMSRRL
jgi:uncharacterized membrane protein YphA (DoxX/SURF4 family)